MCKRSTHRGEGEMRPQRANHVLHEVRLVGVPHEADGNDLRGVHEDASDPDLLPTFALRERKRPKKNTLKPQRNGGRESDLPDSSEGPRWCLPLVRVPQTNHAYAEASVDCMETDKGL